MHAAHSHWTSTLTWGKSLSKAEMKVLIPLAIESLASAAETDDKGNQSVQALLVISVFDGDTCPARDQAEIPAPSTVARDLPPDELSATERGLAFDPLCSFVTIVSS